MPMKLHRVVVNVVAVLVVLLVLCVVLVLCFVVVFVGLWWLSKWSWSSWYLWDVHGSGVVVFDCQDPDVGLSLSLPGLDHTSLCYIGIRR